MNSRRFIIVGTLVFVGVMAAFAYDFNSQASITSPSLAPFEFQHEGAATVDDSRTRDEIELAPFEFQRAGAASPEDAAESLFGACATESPKHFVQHLLLGVCDGPIDTLQKFAECLHSTRFRHGEDSFTVYDLPFGKGINPKKPIRAIASQDFDRENKEVAALQFQMVSTYFDFCSLRCENDRVFQQLPEFSRP